MPGRLLLPTVTDGVASRRPEIMQGYIGGHGEAGPALQTIYSIKT